MSPRQQQHEVSMLIAYKEILPAAGQARRKYLAGYTLFSFVYSF